MRDLNQLTFHPTSERIVEMLCKKTQNNNPKFFRILLAYFLGKMAASMRVQICTRDRGMIPINLYAINLATSGHGKGYSSNIIEEQLINGFREVFMNDTYPVIAEQSLTVLAGQRAVVQDVEEAVMLQKLEKEFDDLGKLAFSFDSGTTPAIKQMRQKLLMANIGGVNLEIDEIGSNLIGNIEPLTTFLELFDVGKVKQKLTKNTKENTRSEEIDGRTPANLLMFGTPSKLFDGGKTEDEFYSLLEIGYARRCVFGYSLQAVKDETITAEQIYDSLTDEDTEQFVRETSARFAKLANIANHGRVLTVPREVGITTIKYRQHCETLAGKMGEHEDIAKAEISHRYFKALKLAGIYAFVDGDSEITEDHLYHAICLVEESGQAFKRILKRDRPYVKLAKYLADLGGKEVTHVELQEDLSFYKGSMTNKQELIQLASAWAFKNHISISRTFVDTIEFFKAETLEQVDMDRMILSYSKDISDGYKNVQAPWTGLHKLTQQPDMHWINHHSDTGHRHTDNMVPGFTLAVFDVDGTASVQECKLLLEDYMYHLYTTKRFTDTSHRFRLIMPLNYKMYMDEETYEEFMKNILAWLPIKAVDAQTLQRSRKWLTHKGNYIYGKGKKMLDARLFIPRTTKAEEQKSFVETYQSMTNMERWFVRHGHSGNRNNQLYRYATLLMDLNYAPKTIETKVLEMNAKLKDKLSDKEILATIVPSVMRKQLKKSA